MLQCYDLRAPLFRRLVRTVVPFADAVCLATAAGASTVHVPGDFTTIQGAINGAPEGATIVIEAGTYYESLHWTGKNLVIRGAGQGRTIIDGGGTSRGLYTNGLSYSSGIEGIT